VARRNKRNEDALKPQKPKSIERKSHAYPYPKKETAPARIEPRKQTAMKMADRVPVKIAHPDDIKQAYWLELEQRVRELRANVDQLMRDAQTMQCKCRGEV